MIQNSPTVPEHELRACLRSAAEQSVNETSHHCLRRMTVADTPDAEALRHQEALAWIVARATDEGWGLLPDEVIDHMAPIAWSVMELVEWASHLTRFELMGDTHVHVPLTWLPRGTHPLGGRDITTAVEERLALLREELGDAGVRVTWGTEVAA